MFIISVHEFKFPCTILCWSLATGCKPPSFLPFCSFLGAEMKLSMPLWAGRNERNRRFRACVCYLLSNDSRESMGLPKSPTDPNGGEK